MPKFYKQNILTQPPQPNPSSEPDYTESFADLGAPPEPKADLSEYLKPTVPPEPDSAPKAMHADHVTPPEPPIKEEPLLPSPLDTPEITAPTESPQAAQSPAENTPPQPQSPPSVSPLIPPSGIAPIPETRLVETLMTWQAPSRPHRKKNRSFYITVATLIILIAMIALLAGERMLVAVLFAFMFLVYVINFIPPQDIEFKLSTQGVTIDSHFYHWQELDSFWFEKKDGFTILHILTELRFPGMLMLVLGPNVNAEDVKHTVARFLPFHEIAPKSILEKWAESLQRYFPLENPNH